MLPGKQNDMIFDGPIQHWDEAVPLGNGQVGCLLWGDGETLRFSLDHGALWEKTPCPSTQREDFRYETMIRLVSSGQWKALSQLFEEPYDCPYPTKLPAGKLLLHFGACSKMRTRLSLDDASASITLTLEDGPLTLRTFLHAENGAGFLLMDRLPIEFSFQVEPPAYSFASEKKLPEEKMNSLDTSELSVFTYPYPERISESNTDGFCLTLSDDLSYSVIARLFHTSKGELFIWNIITTTTPVQLRETALAQIQALASSGFLSNLKSHTMWWHKYWEKSGIRISEKLFEQNWYITQYLLGSCSRKGAPPMPLQGVWTADDGKLPPWKGDYHHDLNTQMCYYPYLKANHVEEGLCFLDFLWDLLPQAKIFAQQFYQADGICLPTVMSIDGQPMCGWPMYSFSPASQIWLCQLFERHYRFTCDQDFLRSRAYPYLKETAKFILSLLQEDADGLLYLPLSSSPEIHGDEPQAWLTPNSNYDLALMRYLFFQLSELSLTVCPEDHPLWHSTLQKLPELALNHNGAYRVSPTEDLTESHRHFSHLMAVHPLRLIAYDIPEHKAVIDACIDEMELLGSGQWVGFSFAWMAELYALQKNGEGAAAQLELFWRYFCSSNGFHVNGDHKKGGFTIWHYRPFTLEGNMCAADALQEMLLFSETDTIELFPAVPKRFKFVSFENFRAQKGLFVSARMEDSIVTFVAIHATQPCQVVLKNGVAFSPICSGRSYVTSIMKNDDLLIQFS